MDRENCTHEAGKVDCLLCFRKPLSSIEEIKIERGQSDMGASSQRALCVSGKEAECD